MHTHLIEQLKILADLREAYDRIATPELKALLKPLSVSLAARIAADMQQVAATPVA